MKLDLNTFKCPECNSSGFEKNDTKDQLVCSNCVATYPIIDGIPRLLKKQDQNYTSNFGKQWNLHRKAQLDSHTGLNISSSRIFETTQWNKNLKGQKILEAGSGAGRFTEVLLKTGADVYSFDFSTAVEANFTNNSKNENLFLFQGDIFNIPFEEGTFDKVFCLGVIQHTPDPYKAFQSLAKMVKPGGELVIDSYAASIGSLISWRYFLRPITTRLPQDLLYKIVERAVNLILPTAKFLNSTLGNWGRKLVPIVEYSHLKLPENVNKEWAVLDTYDWYSPRYDIPQTVPKVRSWFNGEGFKKIEVKRGLNGIVAKGLK